jgi:ABC-2 type transport system ATP-binding protein
MAESLLQVEALAVCYGSVQAVAGVSLSAARGEWLGLIGPNGSGKSSTLAAIAGVLQPVAGLVRVNGLTRHNAPQRYAEQIGYVPQQLAIYTELTVADNLRFFGQLYGLAGGYLKQRMQTVLQQLGLTAYARSVVAKLSGGYQRRVHIGCALLHAPPLLLLDEPSVALDTASRSELLELLDRLRQAGQTIVLTTHLLDEAQRYCDRLVVLEQGRVVASGPVAQLLAQCESAPGQAVSLEGRLVPGAGQPPCPAAMATPGVELAIADGRLTLRATNSQLLGHALARLLASGIRLVDIRSSAYGLGALLKRTGGSV